MTCIGGHMSDLIIKPPDRLYSKIINYDTNTTINYVFDYFNYSNNTLSKEYSIYTIQNNKEIDRSEGIDIVPILLSKIKENHSILVDDEYFRILSTSSWENSRFTTTKSVKRATPINSVLLVGNGKEDNIKITYDKLTFTKPITSLVRGRYASKKVVEKYSSDLIHWTTVRDIISRKPIDVVFKYLKEHQRESYTEYQIKVDKGYKLYLFKTPFINVLRLDANNDTLFLTDDISISNVITDDIYLKLRK